MVEMREIGSEFEVMESSGAAGDPLFWPVGCDFLYTISGRSAIDMVLADAGRIRKALVPTYCCDSMLVPFRRHGIGLEFYAVGYGEDGFQEEFAIPADVDAVLRMSYFGFRDNYPTEALAAFRKRGGVVIEDVTHSLFAREKFGKCSDYAVASLRKWGGLASGGLCVKRGVFRNRELTEPPREFVEKKLGAMHQKKEYLLSPNEERKQEFLRAFAETNHWLGEQFGMAIDPYSAEQFSRWDGAEMTRRRRENATVLYRGLEGLPFVRPLFPLDQMDCPLFVPVVVDAGRRDALCRHLAENGVYCPRHWPHPLTECSSNLYDIELSLVCDQRYGNADMERIVKLLREYR